MTSCPRSFGESTDIVTKLGKEMTKREIILVDQSAAEATTIFMFSISYTGILHYLKHLRLGVLKEIG